MLLLNTVMDRWFLLIGAIMTLTVYFGIALAFFEPDRVLSPGSGFLPSIFFATIAVMLFMYM